jgi:regulator of protease activity HflC (stomatin/prohibitin superfamily)
MPIPNVPPLWQSGNPPPQMPRLPGSRGLLIIGGLVVAGVLIFSSAYTVDPTDMAGVRRLGTVITTEPIGPGLHFKIPFIDTVDQLQTSISTMSIDNLTVYTIDNQAVQIGVSLTYRIPPSAVLKLLYQVGRTGNVDIPANLAPIISDRTLRVFAKHNTLDISSQREAIANEIHAAITDSVTPIFGVDIIDLQLSHLEYSQTFTDSVEEAVKAKNDAVQAENTVARVKYEAEQAKVRAEGLASAVEAAAEGDAQANVTRAGAEKQATILQAEGQAEARITLGKAEAQYAQTLGQSLGGTKVTDYLAIQRWNGQLPTTNVGSGTPLISLPAAGK